MTLVSHSIISEQNNSGHNKCRETSFAPLTEILPVIFSLEEPTISKKYLNLVISTPLSCV